jgi:hypothetical protein
MQRLKAGPLVVRRSGDCDYTVISYCLIESEFEINHMWVDDTKSGQLCVQFM